MSCKDLHPWMPPFFSVFFVVFHDLTPITQLACKYYISLTIAKIDLYHWCFVHRYYLGIDAVVIVFIEFDELIIPAFLPIKPRLEYAWRVTNASPGDISYEFHSLRFLLKILLQFIRYHHLQLFSGRFAVLVVALST